MSSPFPHYISGTQASRLQQLQQEHLIRHSDPAIPLILDLVVRWKYGKSTRRSSRISSSARAIKGSNFFWDVAQSLVKEIFRFQEPSHLQSSFLTCSQTFQGLWYFIKHIMMIGSCRAAHLTQYLCTLCTLSIRAIYPLPTVPQRASQSQWHRNIRRYKVEAP